MKQNHGNIHDGRVRIPSNGYLIDIHQSRFPRNKTRNPSRRGVWHCHMDFKTGALNTNFPPILQQSKNHPLPCDFHLLVL
jgi:hypothetical protein